MAEFLWLDATDGEDEEHLIAVYRMDDGTEERVPYKQMTGFEAQRKNDRKVKDRIKTLEDRVAALEDRVTALVRGVK